jgi:signal transduction histidine kinase
MTDTEKKLREEIASLSHEIRRPLTSIGGFVDGILDGTIPEKNYMHYLRIVSDEVKRLAEITSKMLDTSKIELLEEPVSNQQFSMNETVIRIFCTFEKIIESKGITVEGLDVENTVTVTGDLGMISQALYNIIENAVKYVNSQGCISVSFSSENEFSVFSIRNTGMGISDDEKEKVFDKFYRSETAKKSELDGTGLGLSTAKAIINLHNGTVSADGISDGFAEFTVKLPS